MWARNCSAVPMADRLTTTLVASTASRASHPARASGLRTARGSQSHRRSAALVDTGLPALVARRHHARSLRLRLPLRGGNDSKQELLRLDQLPLALELDGGIQERWTCQIPRRWPTHLLTTPPAGFRHRQSAVRARQVARRPPPRTDIHRPTAASCQASGSQHREDGGCGQAPQGIARGRRPR
jgi:hypothetical protein